MTQVIPAAVAYQKKLAKAIIDTKEVLGSSAIVSSQKDHLKKILELINNIYATNKDIQKKVEDASAIHDEPKKAEFLGSKVKPKMDELREYVDALENIVDDETWPLPKFWEMLFIS
jgi:glutamine synthetase